MPAPVKIGPIEASPLHLVGIIVLLLAWILHMSGMWSPAWSVWKGDTWSSSWSTERSAYRNYNGPWRRSCYRESSSYDYGNGYCGHSNSRTTHGLWLCGTEICVTNVVVNSDYCTNSDFDKCGHLNAVRFFTFIAMVTGIAAVVLSLFPFAAPQQTKYACLGSCAAALVTALCIFLAVCIWAAIKDWERERMRINCSNECHGSGNCGHNQPRRFSCWGVTGPECNNWEECCNDQCEDIDPPYGLDYAFALCCVALVMFIVGGVLVAADQLSKLKK